MEGGRGGWIGILHLGLPIFNSYNVGMKGEIILCLNLNRSIKITEDNFFFKLNRNLSLTKIISNNDIIEI